MTKRTNSPANMSVLPIVAIGYVALLASAPATNATVDEASAVEISRFTMDGGTALRSSIGGLALSGTLGQPDAGSLSGGAFTLTGGFWFGLMPGDENMDGGVDQHDYRVFETCLGGPGGGLEEAFCITLDFDTDGDVDLRDVGAFQRSFDGS